MDETSGDVDGGQKAMKIDKEKFRLLFPNLARELEEGKSFKIDSVRSEQESGEHHNTIDLKGYDPDVIDFIRRCSKEEEAIEIIKYMQNRGEISNAYSEKLLKQLFEKGLESFGSKKGDGYYFTKLGSKSNH